MAAKKRKELSLGDRVKVISLADEGLSARKIADRFDVGKTQIQTIIKNKSDILKAYSEGVPIERKRKMRATGNERVNELTLEWFKCARSKNIPLSGPLLQEKARIFSRELGIENFHASNGWLESFRKRNGIVFSCLSGEAASVSEVTVNEWQARLPHICKEFEPANIFNLDETGMFYRALPTKSLVLKEDQCKGGKKAKERITVLLCCSLLGEKLRPLVIGKSETPRCFKGVSKDDLPVIWKANRKAWMTSDIFKKWIVSVNCELEKATRRILLFCDNASSHQHLKLTNITLQFFPPNATARLQPLDQGIIRAMKAYYRNDLLRHVIARIDEVSTAEEVSRSVNVLDAIIWIDKAWRGVKACTISACFQKAGFQIAGLAVPDALDENSQIITAEQELQELCGENVDEFLSMDDELATFPTLDNSWEEDLFTKAKKISSATDEGKDASSDEDSNETESEFEDEHEEVKMKTYVQVAESLNDIEEFCRKKLDTDLLSRVKEIQSIVNHRRLELMKSKKQTSIRDYFASIS